MIFPQTAPEVLQDAVPTKPRFARTSDDQAAPKPQNPAFIGERDTQATSDRAPDPNAPALPSQSGVAPKNPNDLETTESDYQDGKPAPSPTSPVPPPTSPAVSSTQADPALAESMSSSPSAESLASELKPVPPPLRERLADGPNPVDLPVPRDQPEPESIKETPIQPSRSGQAAAKPADAPKPTPQVAPKDPSFSGFQRKAAIQGSISRTGRSALNVADTPLGRYQASISRAVEQEWQRNCVRHRDFITPGFLTVRFFVEPSGRVRTVRFVGDMETGEVQKGFTLNSIRDAKIPAMPQSLRKEFADDPLELIFNFYF